MSQSEVLVISPEENLSSYIHWKPECDPYTLTKYFQITKMTFKKSPMLSPHHVCITVFPSTPTGLGQSPSPSFASEIRNQTLIKIQKRRLCSIGRTPTGYHLDS